MSQPASRAGVLGGTFDPVHLGHVHAGLAIARVFDLEHVLLVPSATPPHKPGRELAPAEHRLAMLRLAVVGAPRLRVSTIELERGGVSYTIDTMRALRQGGIEPLFVLGADAFAELATWREPQALLDGFDLVVVDRPAAGGEGAPAAVPPGLRTCVEEVAFRDGAGAAALARPGRPRCVFHVRIAPVAVSSREIRELAARGAELGGLVPAEVGRYIHEHGLYRQEVRR